MRRRSKRSIFIAKSSELKRIDYGWQRTAPFKRMVPLLFCLQAMCLLAAAQPALALEEILISYAGPSVTFLPAEVARQRGFFREQNLDIKLLLTRSEVDRAALASGNLDYTLRAGSTFVSAARGLPVRIVLLGTTKPFWGLVVRPEIKSVSDLKGKSMGVPGAARLAADFGEIYSQARRPGSGSRHHLSRRRHRHAHRRHALRLHRQLDDGLRRSISSQEDGPQVY